MIDPWNVDSPRERWTLIDVLIQQGGDQNNDWSLALGRWTDDGAETTDCLALRWNGTNAPESKGNPISRGYPTWFILPAEIASSLMTAVPDEKRQMVEIRLRNIK